jgi:hypothetical protein
MTEDQREQLINLKKVKSSPSLPEDLQTAVNSFIQQAIIVGEYRLDTMPHEYVDNLISTIVKYPEYNFVTKELLEILENELKPKL